MYPTQTEFDNLAYDHSQRNLLSSNRSKKQKSSSLQFHNSSSVYRTWRTQYTGKVTKADEQHRPWGYWEVCEQSLGYDSIDKVIKNRRLMIRRSLVWKASFLSKDCNPYERFQPLPPIHSQYYRILFLSPFSNHPTWRMTNHDISRELTLYAMVE